MTQNSTSTPIAPRPRSLAMAARPRDVLFDVLFAVVGSSSYALWMILNVHQVVTV